MAYLTSPASFPVNAISRLAFRPNPLPPVPSEGLAQANAEA